MLSRFQNITFSNSQINTRIAFPRNIYSPRINSQNIFIIRREYANKKSNKTKLIPFNKLQNKEYKYNDEYEYVEFKENIDTYDYVKEIKEKLEKNKNTFSKFDYRYYIGDIFSEKREFAAVIAGMIVVISSSIIFGFLGCDIMETISYMIIGGMLGLIPGTIIFGICLALELFVSIFIIACIITVISNPQMDFLGEE